MGVYLKHERLDSVGINLSVARVEVLFQVLITKFENQRQLLLTVQHVVKSDNPLPPCGEKNQREKQERKQGRAGRRVEGARGKGGGRRWDNVGRGKEDRSRNQREK